jgi:hypothetical protein
MGMTVMTVRRVVAGVTAAMILLAGCATTGHIDIPTGHTSTPRSSPTSTPANKPTETPTETPTPLPSPDKLVMGQAEGLTQDGANAGDIILAGARVTTRPADLEFGSRPAHGYFVIVGVTATALPTFTAGFDISTTDFYLLAKYGQHFDEGGGNSYDALADSSQELGYTTLAAGETASGKLVFDVPSRHGWIVYAPNIDGQPIAEWKY